MLGHDINTVHGVVSLYSIVSFEVEWIQLFVSYDEYW